MRKGFLIFIIVFISHVGFAQSAWKKYGLENTQLYLFRLANRVDNDLFQAKVSNKNFQKLDEKMYLNGSEVRRKNEFTYVAKKTNLLYGKKLPFFLPANTWVLAFNYSDSYLLVDDASTIEISLKNKTIKSIWLLPEVFDMRAAIAISFKHYLSSTPEQIDALYIPRLNLSEKIDPSKIVKDTILIYSVNKIPKGITLLIKDINLKPHTNQEFTLENALLYKSDLFFYIPTTNLQTKVPHPAKPDECTGKMTDIKGNIGYASGCITGMGSGNCLGILRSSQTQKYKVTVIIEPH